MLHQSEMIRTSDAVKCSCDGLWAEHPPVEEVDNTQLKSQQSDVHHLIPPRHHQTPSTNVVILGVVP